MKKFYIGALVLLGSFYASSYAMEEMAGEEKGTSTSAIDELIAFVDNENMAMDQMMELKKETMAQKMGLIDSQRKKMAAIKKNQLKKWKKNASKYEDDARELLTELTEAKKENLNQWQDFLDTNKEKWTTFISEKQKDLGGEEKAEGFTPGIVAYEEVAAFTAPSNQGTAAYRHEANGKSVTRMPERSIRSMTKDEYDAMNGI